MEKKKEEEDGVGIIILKKLLPRREALNKRYFVDGNWLSMTRIVKLLTDAGYKVTDKKMTILCLANEFKGIKLKPMLGGLAVKPRDPEQFIELSEVLYKAGYRHRNCNLPY